MRILILGALGQLGSEIKFLSKDKSEHDFFFTSKKDINISDKNEIKTFVLNNSIEAIINCAAYTKVDLAEDNEALAYEINAYGVRNIVDICQENNVKLIHISTDYVFDGTSNKAYTETDTCNAIGVYGKSKLLGETYILDSSCKAAIVRTSWLYSSLSANFMKTIIKLAETKKQISVVLDQYGSPCYARDLAAHLLLLVVNLGSQKHQQEIYHYSNQGVASWYDFAHSINRIANLRMKIKPVDTSQYPTKASRPTFSVLDKSKIENFLNIEIPHWQDSLFRCMKEL